MKQIPQNSPDIENWLKLIRAEDVGSKTFFKLIRHFGSADKVLAASISQLKAVDGIGSKTAERIARTREQFDADGELKAAEKLGVWIIDFDDHRYPVVLKKIYDPPPVLYVKGSLSQQDNLCISIVGSRRCSLYGREQASRLAHFLASAGFTICSGMARGIDTAAHQGALSASARTIAVQGCGLKHIFPPENTKLFELIAGSGACISELPLNYEPLAENFPPRNRIIAGLSLATIVVEAGLRSGALITARVAMENNREVMAVPGKIDSPLSKGSHQLIKQGAALVESVDDVIEALGYLGERLKAHTAAAAEKASSQAQGSLHENMQMKLDPHEKIVYEFLDKEPAHIEQIINATNLQPGKVNANLISLQLKGLVKQLPGNLFLKR